MDRKKKQMESVERAKELLESLGEALTETEKRQVVGGEGTLQKCDLLAVDA